eukprot:Rhum_TRINITY_DN14420_c34_g1::Rhum_TRINITY_DN14420_c34_g1_i1::g.89585::m.89585
MGHVIEGLANLGFSGGGKMGGGAAASGYGTPAPAGRGFSMSQQQIQQMMLLQQQQQQQQQQRNQASLQQQQQKQSGGLGFPLPYAGGKGSFSHFPHSGPSPDIPLQDAYLQQYLQQQQQQHQQTPTETPVERFGSSSDGLEGSSPVDVLPVRSFSDNEVVRVHRASVCSLQSVASDAEREVRQAMDAKRLPRSPSRSRL